jgi:GT2 family glycosyltransferase
MIQSIIIPTINVSKRILECIDSIQYQSIPPDEIIIVDSSKNNSLKKILDNRYKKKTQINIKYYHKSLTLTEARNYGIHQCKGDLIYFLDDDTILDRKYIEKMFEIFEKDHTKKIAGATGNIITEKKRKGSLKEYSRSSFRKLFFLSSKGNGRFKASGWPTWAMGEEVVETQSLYGCSMAFRREILDKFRFNEYLGKIGGYCYMEDVDISYRISKEHRLIYNPYSRLKHAPSEKRLTKHQITKRKEQLIFNFIYLFQKNMPKHFFNLFSFTISLFGLFVLTLTHFRAEEVIGLLKGLVRANFIQV